MHSVFPFGETLHFTDARLDVPASTAMEDVVGFLAARGIPDAVVRRIEPTIEDAFMALMGASDDARSAA